MNYQGPWWSYVSFPRGKWYDYAINAMEIGAELPTNSQIKAILDANGGSVTNSGYEYFPTVTEDG